MKIEAGTVVGIDTKHRLRVPKDVARARGWSAGEDPISLWLEILGVGWARLMSEKTAGDRVVAIRRRQPNDLEGDDLRSVEAAIGDRLRKVRFYPEECRVTLGTPVHAVFDAGLVPVQVYVEPWEDGLQILSLDRRIARLEDLVS
jgi:hypothetical protein